MTGAVVILLVITVCISTETSVENVDSSDVKIMRKILPIKEKNEVNSIKGKKPSGDKKDRNGNNRRRKIKGKKMIRKGKTSKQIRKVQKTKTKIKRQSNKKRRRLQSMQKRKVLYKKGKQITMLQKKINPLKKQHNNIGKRNKRKLDCKEMCKRTKNFIIQIERLFYKFRTINARKTKVNAFIKLSQIIDNKCEKTVNQSKLISALVNCSQKINESCVTSKYPENLEINGTCHEYIKEKKPSDNECGKFLSKCNLTEFKIYVQANSCVPTDVSKDMKNALRKCVKAGVRPCKEYEAEAIDYIHNCQAMKIESPTTSLPTTPLPTTSADCLYGETKIGGRCYSCISAQDSISIINNTLVTNRDKFENVAENEFQLVNTTVNKITDYLENNCGKKENSSACISTKILEFDASLWNILDHINTAKNIRQGGGNTLKLDFTKFNEIMLDALMAQKDCSHIIKYTCPDGQIKEGDTCYSQIDIGGECLATCKAAPVTTASPFNISTRRTMFRRRLKLHDLLLRNYRQCRQATGCSPPPFQYNGKWKCDEENRHCFLKCNPGYVALYSTTTCCDGVWSNIKIMECLPAIYLLLGDSSSSYGNVSCNALPSRYEMTNLTSSSSESFVHNSVLYKCGGFEFHEEFPTRRNLSIDYSLKKRQVIEYHPLCLSINLNNDSFKWKAHYSSNVSSRFGHSTVVLKNELYIIGGISNGDYAKHVKASLPLQVNSQFTEISSTVIPYQFLFGHCLLKLNEDSFLIIEKGGYVTKYDITKQTITSFPKFDTYADNKYFGCIMIEEEGKRWSVVAGGDIGYQYYGDNAELRTGRLDLDGGVDWELMGDLELPRSIFGMISTENGIVALGGYIRYTNSKAWVLDKSVEILNWTTQQWKLIRESSLKYRIYGYGNPAAIPAYLFKCNITEKPAPPSLEHNVNIADKCCFIIQGSGYGIYILTRYSSNKCPSSPKTSKVGGCAYTKFDNDEPDLFTNLSHILETKKIFCIDDIAKPICCSERSGIFCRNYTDEAGGLKNIRERGACSSKCTKIANCSKDPTDIWCESDTNIKISNDGEKIPNVTLTDGKEFEYHDYSKLNSSKGCISTKLAVEEQSAVFHPRALNRTKSRSTYTCGAWNAWIFNCWHLFGYSENPSGKNWFRWYEWQRFENEWRASTGCYYIEADCCTELQTICCDGITEYCPYKCSNEGSFCRNLRATRPSISELACSGKRQGDECNKKCCLVDESNRCCQDGATCTTCGGVLKCKRYGIC